MRQTRPIGTVSFRTLLALLALAFPAAGTTVQAAPASAFDFGFTAIEGEPLPLAKFKGNVLLVVNTASFCGYTPQYQGLQELWSRKEAEGLVIIGVPSNDFGGQEPKAEAEIKTFCQGAFGVTFPLTTKEVVSGEQAHPFYRWAATELGGASQPRWNFHKYLVGRDGQLIASFGASVEPLSDTLRAAIDAALAKRP
jgi:glutathione peroxidase